VKCAFVIAVALLGGCKDKEALKPPARTSPPAAGSIEPVAPAIASPAAPTIDAPVIDAADPIDAPPTRSELALAARAELFSKVAKAAKLGASNCGGLIGALEGMTAEVRAMVARRAEVTGAEVAQDDALVASTLRALTRIVSACPEKDRFDAFLNTLGEVPR
jgi:hypothetical protein